jgi:hypothetical protein
MSAVIHSHTPLPHHVRIPYILFCNCLQLLAVLFNYDVYSGCVTWNGRTVDISELVRMWKGR